MIFQNFFSLPFFLFLSISCQEISKNCVCGHVQSQIDCLNSGFCIWQNNVCILKSGSIYKERDFNQTNCNNFAEEDCRIQKQCGFYLGKCIRFTDCNIFNKEYCQESSHQCVSDGKKCVEMLECNNYKTENGCANKDQYGKYCFWLEGEKKCKNVTICEELPIYLISHIMCKEGLNGCTVDEKGYGCVKQMDSCTQYYNYLQCYESKQKQDNCFWDYSISKCVEKVCENLQFSQDYECKSYLNECTSNGIHCIQRRQCNDVENKFGCVTDAQGNKCEYHQNQCKIKSCNTASDSLKNYEQCQSYDNLLDCVFSENGGCKQRPKTCDGYVGEVDCYSIEEQDCKWYNNKCEKRKCYHAPIYYNQQDCKQYGNCIGKIGGGCQETPYICDLIFEEEFCEYNYNKEKCIWLKDQCTLLECNQLKLPTYNSHSICQKASSFCTFNMDSLGCTDYLCENTFEIEFCQIDSTGTSCVLNQGCIDKKCRTASTSYESNQQCEEWLPYCTVNVQILSNSKLLIGCQNKKQDCQFALEEQCYSTFSGINCKWDNVDQICIYKVCTDADPQLYLSNEDCNSFKVVEGICILGSSDFGCELWSNDCSLLKSQFQCSLNLQDGTKCFWTGSLCKTLECTDASILDYTNHIQCNSWIDYCIFNSISGGCMNRPSSVSCSSSPNESMYDTHQECIAWNPKCTVISSFNAEGCELKKSSCQEFIRPRNCKTNLSGQNCYWNDYQQKCDDELDDNDCKKRMYGDLSHQDCENFFSKCTVSNINRFCVNLSSFCDYRSEQQCVITKDQQPCKWDYKNQICKDVMCNENLTAEIEAECLNFRKFNQCQLKIQSNGTFGPGCESRPYYCEQITNSIICKLTLTQNHQRCYYFNSRCQQVLDYQCEFIKDSQSNELCQLYNPYCILQQSGQGCYSILSCSQLSKNICNSAIMKFNNKCIYSDYCREDNNCSGKYPSSSTCDNRKTGQGQLCYLYIEQRKYWYTDNKRYYYYSYYDCRLQTASYSMYFNPSTSLSDKRILCQNYSSNYKYDTGCNCCVYMTSCTQQKNEYKICNSSTANSKCGFNFSTNTCETRKCEHLNYTDYSIITDQICYDWNYDCVLGITGCKTYTGDCISIKLIYQCYQYQCFWQDGKCVSNVDCQINTTAVSNRQCLLINAQFCRFNYIKGLGCAFINCSHIKNSTICNSSTLVDGQNCIWINNNCQSKYCQDYTTQSDCENNYGYYSTLATKCFWCTYNSINCSNHQYCSLSSMISPKSHKDCHNVNILTTIGFSMNAMSTKCTVKKQLCSQYTYEDACVSTINGLRCYWSSNLCVDMCSAAIFTHSSTNLQCFNWHSDCMSDANSSCQLLNCTSLITIQDCTIFAAKCFWGSSSCQTIGSCILYSDNTLCLDNKNSQGNPCFWDVNQCIEKTCQNKPIGIVCHDWLANCQINTNNGQCIEDCTSADTTYITHNQCDSYYFNKSCTVKLDLIQCVDLPISCNLAKKTQCYMDRDGKQCFFEIQSQQCLVLTCSNLVTPINTHEKCYQTLNECTVNTTLNGCQQLNDCSNYLIKEQCQIDQNNVGCEWIMSENKCTIKKCSTAQLNQFTAYSCQQYFDDSCTVNINLDGCEIGQSFCINYTYHQCISDGQMNLKGVGCFWNLEKSICQEKICVNGPSNAQSHSECAVFLSTCQKGGCRIKGCFDYNYAVDSACASIFEDKRCVTNGYRCVLRRACEDINIIDGCTFDVNLNPCVWIDGKCYNKTCQTADISFTKYDECNSYLPYCTVKKEGGCIIKQSCQDYQFKEACITDSENYECIWDDYINKCFSNQCIDFCGNGIILSKEEQCDDGNYRMYQSRYYIYLPYDGCYKCQVQCPQGCNICIGGQCQECNQNGWLLVDGVCTSRCGDGYAVGNEQCDDGNNIQFDGCYQCSYSCHKKCLNCFQGQCLECEIGFLEDRSFCHNICGDGYVLKQLEECDDGNINNNDGCSNTCKVEQNWQCETENNTSFCIYIILPKIILTKISKTDTSIQEFKLSFSEPVCLNEKNISEEQFLQLIVIDIKNAKNQDYDIEIKPINSITSELADVAYKIIVNFKANIQNPVLQVKLNSDNIVNNKGNILFSNEAKLDLKSPYKISTDQQSLINKTSMLGRIVLYIILIISGISFLCGNLEILWNLLDMLQQLSYMKFHNTQFPENLQIYFEIFTIGSFTPIIDKFQIDLYIQNYFNFQIPVIPAKWKFEQYQINCSFFQNFQTLLTVFVMGFIYFIFSYFLYKFLIFSKYQDWPTIFYKSAYNFFLKIVKYTFFIEKLARQHYQYFIYSGLIRIFTSNFYEFTFASILQLVNMNKETTLNITINFIAIFAFIFNIILLASFFSYLSSKNKVSKNLLVLVEGIKNKEYQGSKQYFTILLLKKTLFIINLIILQELAGVQSLITACLSGIFSYYINYYKPFENNYENIKIIITEVLIMLNAIIFSFYDIMKLNQDQESAELLGWINIGGFTLILILTLAIDIYQKCDCQSKNVLQNQSREKIQLKNPFLLKYNQIYNGYFFYKFFLFLYSFNYVQFLYYVKLYLRMKILYFYFFLIYLQ